MCSDYCVENDIKRDEAINTVKKWHVEQYGEKGREICSCMDFSTQPDEEGYR